MFNINMNRKSLLTNDLSQYIKKCTFDYIDTKMNNGRKDIYNSLELVTSSPMNPKGHSFIGVLFVLSLPLFIYSFYSNKK